MLGEYSFVDDATQCRSRWNCELVQGFQSAAKLIEEQDIGIPCGKNDCAAQLRSCTHQEFSQMLRFFLGVRGTPNLTQPGEVSVNFRVRRKPHHPGPSSA